MGSERVVSGKSVHRCGSMNDAMNRPTAFRPALMAVDALRCLAPPHERTTLVVRVSLSGCAICHHISTDGGVTA
jgi:hypothetical protein